MTAIEKIEAQEQKERMYVKAHGRCYYCNKPLTLSACHLAHRIHKGYVRMYGPKIIHSELNMRITCADCNHKALLSFAANPIEAAKLIENIKENL